MNFAHELRSDLDNISVILQSLTAMHTSGVDRTSLGCHGMAALAAALENALGDLGATISDINRHS